MDEARILLEEIATFGQAFLEKFPVIVLGSGASIPYGLTNMDCLRIEIENICLPKKLENQEEKSSVGKTEKSDTTPHLSHHPYTYNLHTATGSSMGQVSDDNGVAII